MKKIITISAPALALAMVMALVFWGNVTAGGDTPAMGAANKQMADSGKSVVTKGILDGKVYVGEMGAEGKTSGDKETIKFIAGMFYSSQCESMGYHMAPYTTTTEGDAIKFRATMEDAAKNKHEWEGTIKGEALDATVTMTSEKAPTTTMWAKATLEKAPAKMNTNPPENPTE